VIVKPGIHQELLVYEHDDRNFDGWTDTAVRKRDLVAHKDLGERMEVSGLLWLLGRINQSARQCCPMSNMGLHDTLGGLAD
jgi:hypothetical protein